MNIARLATLVVLMVGATVGWANDNSPRRINFQGMLTGPGGVPVPDLSRPLTIRFYPDAQGGTPIWSETQQVTTLNGVYNMILGSVTPLDLPFDQPYWLSIQVEQEPEMPQRIALTSAPYAFHAMTADSLTGTAPGGTITGVTAGAGLTGGGTSGNITLEVGPGDGITVTADAVSVHTSDLAGAGLVEDGASNDLKVNAGVGLEVGADSVRLSPNYRTGSAWDGRFVNESQSSSISTAMIQVNAVTADKVAPNILSSVNGVSNDGGDIDLLAGSGIIITPDDPANTITISATGSGGDVTDVLAGTGITVQNPGGPQPTVNLDTTYGDGRYVNENQAGAIGTTMIADNAVATAKIADGAVSTAKVVDSAINGAKIADNSVAAADISPNIVSSLDGVSNDGGNIDLVAGSGIIITANDPANTITIASGGLGGSGTAGMLAKFTASGTLGNSLLQEDAAVGRIGLGITPSATLDVYQIGSNDPVIRGRYIDAGGFGHVGVIGQRDGQAGADGTGYSLGLSNAAVRGTNTYGNAYSFAVSGYSNNSGPGPTAGVFGACDGNAATFGALGYRNADGCYGLFATNGYAGTFDVLHLRAKDTFYADLGIATGEPRDNAVGTCFGNKFSDSASIDTVVVCNSARISWDHANHQLKITETNAGNHYAHYSGSYQDEAGSHFLDNFVYNGMTTVIATLNQNGEHVSLELTSEEFNAGYVHLYAMYSNGKFMAHYYYAYF